MCVFIYTDIGIDVDLSLSLSLFRSLLLSEKLIYFKELAHVIVEAGKSEICRAGCETGNSSKS